MLDAKFVRSLFAPDVPEPSHWEATYPLRNLPEGAVVTRFGPSPTGFLHTGGVYVATIGKDLARNSGGVYFIRIEDTDRTREIPEARGQFARAFAYFSIESDENDQNAPWGPYDQSKRELIYHTYARELLLQAHAYPCFCSRDDLALAADNQRIAKVPPGYYGEWAKCRDLPSDLVEERIRSGQPYTIRFRSPDGQPGRVVYNDLIRGDIEQIDNRNDIVILKSSDQPLRLPTYHFAHAVDDHLMRVTLILRGEEWISSVPLHLQIFAALGFQPVPYAHIAPLMKMEGTSRRKLSKRKDPEANVEFYISSGFPAGTVRHYLRGLANAKVADMGFAEALARPLSLADCGVSGPLFDIVKLESIGRNYISEMSVDETLTAVRAWADNYDPELAVVLSEQTELARKVLSLDAGGVHTARKEMSKWSEFRRVYGLFFRRLFQDVTDASDERFAPLSAEMVKTLAAEFAESYQHFDNQTDWFEQTRRLAMANGFAPSVGDFKRAPTEFNGSIRDVGNVMRVAITGATRSRELFDVAQILGQEEVLRRVRALL